MKAKLLKVIFISIILIISALLSLAFLIGEESEYTEKNMLTYFLKTPSVIAKVPRISKNYSFYSTPDDNYGFERNAIVFREIKNYEQQKKIVEEYVIQQRTQLDRQEYELNVSYPLPGQDNLSVILTHYTR